MGPEKEDGKEGLTDGFGGVRLKDSLDGPGERDATLRGTLDGRLEQ